MSTREHAIHILNHLSDIQLEAFITLFSRLVIEEEEPDNWDKAMIADSYTDNDESMPLDAFVESLGFEPDAFKGKHV